MIETMKMPQIRKAVSTEKIFYFFVDYSKPFEEMRSSGIFLSVDDEIVEKHFPISSQRKGIIPYEATYFYWGLPLPAFVVARGIIQEDSERPWSLSRIEHAFALGTIMPEAESIHSQRSVMIPDAHHTVGNEHYTVCMDCEKQVWRLTCSKRRDKCDASASFLAVREIGN